MRRLALLGAILLGLSGTAHAQPAGHALLRAASALSIPTALCPAGVPTQTITVVNQAGVRPFALAKVENAVVAQSLQLRAAWGTPCVTFAAGGWPVRLLIGGETHGVHSALPYAQVWTGGVVWHWWSQAFSHEIDEMLVDPTTNRTYYAGQHTIAVENYPGAPLTTAIELDWHALEVCDPVDERAYRLAGVWVSDFALPAYYAGADYGVDGPLIAPADAPGPYDEMGLLTAPWQTQWARTS